MIKTKRIRTVVIFVLAILFLFSSLVFASSPTDEILLYEITASVNSDASVDFIYHIQWKVLDDSIGTVSWLQIGAPNSSAYNVQGLTSNIDYMEYDEYSGNVLVYFDKDYSENEVIDFSYSYTCDYMYQIDGMNSGETIYYFVPGWFDGVAVDQLVVKWKDEKVCLYEESASAVDGYITWEKTLSPGESIALYVCYPNDAYNFSPEHQEGMNPSNSSDYDDNNSGGLFAVLFAMAPMLIILFFFIVVVANSKARYSEGSGFASGKTTEKVTRSKVVYYDNCPGCGAPREENKEVCSYCGHSMVESEELIEEEELKDEDKEALKYKNEGLYHYGAYPNTFIRVHVTHVPIVPVGSSSSRAHSGGCVHSSCACACVSCACACACAGGGRAGCSVKNFYSKGLKLRQLEKIVRR